MNLIKRAFLNLFRKLIIESLFELFDGEKTIKMDDAKDWEGLYHTTSKERTDLKNLMVRYMAEHFRDKMLADNIRKIINKCFKRIDYRIESEKTERNLIFDMVEEMKTEKWLDNFIDRINKKQLM